MKITEANIQFRKDESLFKTEKFGINKLNSM